MHFVIAMTQSPMCVYVFSEHMLFLLPNQRAIMIKGKKKY